MDTPSESIRNLARRLLLLEASVPSERGEHQAERVCEKLRISLTRFAGADGFLALMRRSLARARVEVPSLNNLTMGPDGCFLGFETALDGDANEAGAALTAHFLSLLVTFVGEPLALRLVSDAWPNLPIEE